MRQFNVQEAKSKVSRQLDMTLEGEEALITRHGNPVATLTPARSKTGKRVLGAGRGSVTVLDDDWHKPMADEESDAFWSGRW
jgi:antitoxin (DNA-binding transcriptional repressor) of toxin-antitoxin stability system